MLENNRILFSSTHNSNFCRKIQLITHSSLETLSYNVVFGSQIMNLIDSAAKSKIVEFDFASIQLSDISDVQLQFGPVSFSVYEFNFNLAVLKAVILKYKQESSSHNGLLTVDEEFEEGDLAEVNMSSQEKASSVQRSQLEEKVTMHLNTASLMEFNLKQLLHNEVRGFLIQMNLNSTQKKISEIYHSYARTVKLDDFINKPAKPEKRPTELYNFRKLSQNSEVAVGNQPSNMSEYSECKEAPLVTIPLHNPKLAFPEPVDPSLPPDHFIGKKPPGSPALTPGLSRPVMFLNNVRVIKALNDSLASPAKACDDLSTQSSRIEEIQDKVLDKIKVLKESINPSLRKPIVILNNSVERHAGRLKFFKEADKYGFITLENKDEDVFVYSDQLVLANLTPQDFKVFQDGKKLLVEFTIVTYIGKHQTKSRKAIDLVVVGRSVR